ncbi:MAG: hypothetical protein H0X51_06445 [Parachlamydiaceae bacterium]|nr:hypothetical protein [Parachlamydiaceae bacterium]
MSNVATPQISGSYRELLKLFFPILAMTFSNGLFLLVEKLLLARYSIEAMEVAVNAAYASQITQAACIALVMMAQVYVGRWVGAGELHRIGHAIWQLIWFSFLSMLVTVPFNIIYGYFYFRDTAIASNVMPYYYCLVAMNFLFPLAATLSSFYLGQGKTRFVLWATIIAQGIKLIFAYILILGWGKIPAYGLMGGVISTFIAQAGFCIVLFCVFLNKKHSLLYNTHEWKFDLKLFKECIHPGFLRAMNRILSTTCWASIAHLMSSKGGDSLLILSLGGSLSLFLPFLSDAICQAQATIVSNILGAKNYQFLGKAFNSGLVLVLVAVGLMGIPLLFFPEHLLYYLFPTVVLDKATTYIVFFGVWASFAFFTFSFLPISYILAFKDTKFSLFMGFVNWINGFALMYVAIDIVQIEARHFWLVLSIMHATNALCYLLRMRWLQSKLFVQLST